MNYPAIIIGPEKTAAMAQLKVLGFSSANEFSANRAAARLAADQRRVEPETELR